MAVVLPIAVLMVLYLYVDQVRRLIAHATLNGTIRKALASDPASVPLLVAKIESGPRGLAGWVTLAIGLGLLAAAFVGPAEERASMLQAGMMTLALGIALTAWAWWVSRRTPTGG